MCQALRELMKEELDEKYEAGMETGILQGMQQGMQQGTQLLLIAQVKDGEISMESAAKRLGVTVKEFKGLME